MLSSNRLTWKPSGGGCPFRTTRDSWTGPFSFGWGGVSDAAADPDDDFSSGGLSSNYNYRTVPQDATKIRVYLTPEGFGPNCVTVDFCESGGFECPADSICCGAGPGACCRPDGSCDDNVYEIPCTNSGGLYQGEGVSCDSIDCPQPIGRCCEDGDPCALCKTCRNSTAEGCTDGTWTEGVTCPEDFDDKVTVCGGETFYCFDRACCDGNDCEVKPPCNCENPLDVASCANDPCDGACCKLDGSCEDGVDKNTCESAGGRFQGPGTLCADITCPSSSWFCPNNDCPPCVRAFDDEYPDGTGYASETTCNSNCGQAYCCINGSCVPLVPPLTCPPGDQYNCEEDCESGCSTLVPTGSVEELYLSKLGDSNQLTTEPSLGPEVPGGKLPKVGETLSYEQAVYLYGINKVPGTLPTTTTKLARAYRTKVVSLIPSTNQFASHVYRSTETESMVSSDISLINSSFGDQTCNICDGGQAPEPIMVDCSTAKTAKLIMEYDVSETCTYDDLEIGVKSFNAGYDAGAPQEKVISIIITVKDQNENRIKIIEDQVSSGYFIENGNPTYDCDTCEAGYECSTTVTSGGYSFYPELNLIESGSVFRYRKREVDYTSLVPPNPNEEPRKITARILGFTEKTEDLEDMRLLRPDEEDMSLIRIQDHSSLITNLSHGPAGPALPPRLASELRNDADRVESESNGEQYINGNLQDNYGYPGGCSLDGLSEIQEGPRLAGIVFVGDESGCPDGQLCSNSLLLDDNFSSASFIVTSTPNLAIPTEQGYSIPPRTIGNAPSGTESYIWGYNAGGTRSLISQQFGGEATRKFGGVVFDTQAYNHRIEADFFVNGVGIENTSSMAVMLNIPSSDINVSYSDNTMIKLGLYGSGGQFSPKIEQYYNGSTNYVGEGQSVITDNSYTGNSITVQANETIKLIGYVYENNRFKYEIYKGEELLFEHDDTIRIPSNNGTYVAVSLPKNIDASLTTYCTNLKIYN